MARETDRRRGSRKGAKAQRLREGFSTAECGFRTGEWGMVNVEKGREIRNGGDGWRVLECGLRNADCGIIGIGGFAAWREKRVGGEVHAKAQRRKD